SGKASSSTYGTASSDATFSTQGSHSITAAYSGDPTFLSATSPAIGQVVNGKTATLGVTSTPNPSIVGAAVTLTATLTPATATGTVQFHDGATARQTATL